MLRQYTDLPTTVLKRFEGDMHASVKAQFLGVELSESLLTDIGYFVDYSLAKSASRLSRRHTRGIRHLPDMTTHTCCRGHE